MSIIYIEDENIGQERLSKKALVMMLERLAGAAWEATNGAREDSKTHAAIVNLDDYVELVLAFDAITHISTPTVDLPSKVGYCLREFLKC